MSSFTRASRALILSIAVLLAPPAFAEGPFVSVADFARRNGVPLAEVGLTAENASPGTDERLAMRAYAVGAAALRRGWTDPATGRLIGEVALPALRAGAFRVLSVPRKRIMGAAALYDFRKDTLEIAGLDLAAPETHRMIIHELVHAAQDACRHAQIRRDSEYDAYLAEAEYELRRKGVIARVPGGTRVGPVDVSLLAPFQGLAALRQAWENVREGRPELNSFSGESKKRFGGTPPAEVEAGLEKSFLELREETRDGWLIDTGLAGTREGRRDDPGELLRKNGLGSPPWKPASGACGRPRTR